MKNVKGHIVDVVRREIYDGELVITDEKIAEVKRCTLPKQEKPWPYVMPGFIDSHVHIESSMMVPHKFARIAVSHGTIGVMADPHEIGNVLGIKGVDYMIRSGQEACFNFLNNLKVIHRATNLFDNKTLAIHPYSTIFGNFTAEERANMDVFDTTIRISVGLEDVDDLAEDMEQALHK